MAENVPRILTHVFISTFEKPENLEHHENLVKPVNKARENKLRARCVIYKNAFFYNEK